jgi:hypothetical protein
MLMNSSQKPYPMDIMVSTPLPRLRSNIRPNLNRSSSKIWTTKGHSYFQNQLPLLSNPHQLERRNRGDVDEHYIPSNSCYTFVHTTLWIYSGCGSHSSNDIRTIQKLHWFSSIAVFCCYFSEKTSVNIPSMNTTKSCKAYI